MPYCRGAKKHLRIRRRDGGMRSTFPPYSQTRLQRTHVVALADFNAVVTDDVVGGGAVEEEVRQTEMQQVGLSLERHLPLAGLPADVLVFRAVELRRGESLDEIERLRNPRLGLGERRVGIGERRQVHAGQTARRIAPEISRLTDLAAKREHIREQPQL